MSELDLVLLISGIVAILIGIGIFFLAGIYHVKKDRAIVIEKAGLFYKVCGPGWHFFTPIAYQRKGTYITVPQIVRITVNDGIKLEVTYKIIDIEKYHYSGVTIEGLVNKIKKESSDLTIATFKDRFEKIGVDFISIKRPEY